MRVLRTVRSQYDTDNGEAKAAIADAITAAPICVALTVLYFQVVNYLGAHYPKGTQEALGYIGIQNYLQWGNLLMVVTLGALSFLLSYVAIILASREKRPLAFKRSTFKTTCATLVAVASTTAAGVLIVQQLTLATVLESLTTLGFIAVPAALRLTSPKAFSYRCPDFTTIVGWTSEIDETP